VAGEAPRCSATSLALNESQIATASTVRSWILLEQSGPWGYHAIAESRMVEDVARALRAKARALKIRLILLRRPGRASTEDAGTRCWLAHTGPSATLLEQVHLPGGPADLLPLDLEPLTRGLPTGIGAPDRDPLFLVCTNGRRDPCCAERGRPLAQKLAPEFGDRVWECSHIGGDRFAGNLVCFPHGIYFGRVQPEDVVRIALDYRDGLIDLDHFRGRSSLDFPVQAAEHFIRTRTGLRGVDALRLARHSAVGTDEMEAEFEDLEGTAHRIRVRIERATVPRLITCRSVEPERPASYQVPTKPGAQGRAG
jgi:hypothetical protein